MPHSPLKRLSAALFAALLLLPGGAAAQGTAGPAAPAFGAAQTLTAAALNAALAAPTITGGSINGSIIGASNAQSGRFTTLTALSDISQSAGAFSLLGSGAVAIGDGTARKTFTHTSYLNPSSGTLAPLFLVQGNAFGTITNSVAVATVRAFNVNTDSINATGAQGGGLAHNYFGGTISSGASGGRNGLKSFLSHVGPSTAGGTFYVALAGFAESVGAAGGTAGTAMGNLFGSNISSLLKTGSGLYWNQVVGLEVNVGTQTGTGVKDKVGIQVVQWGTDAVAASRSEIGLLFAAQVYDQVIGWKQGIAFGAQHGTWPMHPSGTLIGLGEQNKDLTGRYPIVVARGIDFATIPAKFTTGTFAAPGFAIDGAGQVTIGSNTIGWGATGLTLGAAGKVGTLSSIAAGGSAYRVGDILRGADGGIYEVATVSSGAITGLTTIKAATIASGSAPSNPRALSGGMGTGATINVTWADAPVVAIGSGRLRHSFATLAGAGTTQGGATPITTSFVFASATSGQDALRLPPAKAGDAITVHVSRLTAASVKVFPASGEYMGLTGGALDPDEAITGAAGVELHFRCMEDGLWLVTTTAFTL